MGGMQYSHGQLYYSTRACAHDILLYPKNSHLFIALKNGKEEVVMAQRAVAEITRANVTVLLSQFD